MADLERRHPTNGYPYTDQEIEADASIAATVKALKREAPIYHG